MERLVSAVRQAVPSHMPITYDRLEDQNRHAFVIRQGMRTFELDILKYRDNSQRIELKCTNLALIDFSALLGRQHAPHTLALHGVVVLGTANMQVRTRVDNEQLFADNIRRVLHPLLCQVGSEQ